MFCGRRTNARINNIHERALRTVYNDEKSLFKELLRRDKSETIYPSKKYDISCRVN